MAITKERLVKILEELIQEESEAVERYELLSNEIAFNEKLPKFLREDLSVALLEILADEEAHKEILERNLSKLKDFMS